MNFNFLINNDLKYLIPEIFYFIVILLLLLFFVFYSNINIYKYTKIVKPLITLIIINFLIYIILILNSINYNNSISFYLLLNNNLTIFLKMLLQYAETRSLNSKYGFQKTRPMRFLSHRTQSCWKLYFQKWKD